MKLVPVAVALAAALVLSGTAFAQTAAPAAEPAASPLSFNISLTSNYKSRGQDQDQSDTKSFKPALQGGVDYAFANGFYVGNWNSMVNWTKYLPSNPSNSLEIDLYGGYKFKAGPLDMDVGALTYYYPGADSADTTEVYAGATYGPVTLKYSRTVSKGYFGTGYTTSDGRGTGYLNLAFAQEVMPKVTLKASVGQTMFKSAVKDAGIPDYMDYSVGASYDLGNGLSMSGALVGANQQSSYTYSIDPSKSVNKNTLVVMLTKTL
jgi:uncharacterized protein (TIGR02001 family)